MRRFQAGLKIWGPILGRSSITPALGLGARQPGAGLFVPCMPWGSSFIDRSGLHFALGVLAASPIDQYPPWHAHPAAAAAIADCASAICSGARRGLRAGTMRRRSTAHVSTEQDAAAPQRRSAGSGSMVRGCLGTQRLMKSKLFRLAFDLRGCLA